MADELPSSWLSEPPGWPLPFPPGTGASLPASDWARSELRPPAGRQRPGWSRDRAGSTPYTARALAVAVPRPAIREAGVPAAPVIAAPAPHLLPAYAACTDIIRRHSASFYFSASLLPPAKKQAVLALYAFCRASDELVDAATARGVPAPRVARDLADWSRRCAPLYPAPAETHPVVAAWADTRRRYRIPQALADELLAGVGMDIHITRYATWPELQIYCYRVASTVGQMSMHITGALRPAARAYAIRLGVALQLTNILRDVGEDARQGRIYLPLDDLARFGYSPAELLAGTRNDHFVALMRFEIARARALYRQAWPGIAMLAPDSRLAVTVAAAVYRAILIRIEANEYDVFTRRARVPTRGKLALLSWAWWQVRRAEPSWGP